MSEYYRNFIRSLPCLICRDPTATEAAHIRFADARAAKPITGMGTRPPDSWLVPLCGKHHREQHSGGEKIFWNLYRIDPIFVAMALERNAGDINAAELIISNARRE